VGVTPFGVVHLAAVLSFVRAGSGVFGLLAFEGGLLVGLHHVLLRWWACCGSGSAGLLGDVVAGGDGRVKDLLQGDAVVDLLDRGQDQADGARQDGGQVLGRGELVRRGDEHLGGQPQGVVASEGLDHFGVDRGLQGQAIDEFAGGVLGDRGQQQEVKVLGVGGRVVLEQPGRARGAEGDVVAFVDLGG